MKSLESLKWACIEDSDSDMKGVDVVMNNNSRRDDSIEKGTQSESKVVGRVKDFMANTEKKLVENIEDIMKEKRDSNANDTGDFSGFVEQGGKKVKKTKNTK